MQKTPQIIGLDALRFAAAFLVLAFHLAFWNWTKVVDPALPAQTAYQALRAYTWFGWVGVEIFFVLSGFVIAYSAQGTDCWTFLRHRITRLLPATVLCAPLSTLAIFLRPLHPPSGPLLRMMLKSIFFYPIGPWVDDAYWTLGIEIAFYAVLFALLFFNRLQLLPAVIGTIGCLSTLFWVAALLPWRGERLQHLVFSRIELRDGANVLLIRHGCYFAIGVFLWLLLFRPIQRRRLVLLAFCIGGGILQIVWRTGFIGRQSGYSFSPFLPIAMWLASLAAIAASVGYNECLRRVAGDCGTRILRSFGLMTYPLYLLHQTIGIDVIRALQNRVSNGTALALGCLFVCLLAFLVSTYAEPPLQSMLRLLLVKALPSREFPLVPKKVILQDSAA